MTPLKGIAAACVLSAACALSGCTNPDAPPAGARGEGAGASVGSEPGSPGEPTAPAAPTPASQQPAAPKGTPREALAQFAGIYINWSYLDLQARQRTLAEISVGAARLAERQAAVTSQGDPGIREGHIRNSGTVLTVSENTQQPGQWVIVTREQTAGNSSYQGLPASLHVTLAHLAPVPGGYAVSEWLPQS